MPSMQRSTPKTANYSTENESHMPAKIRSLGVYNTYKLYVTNLLYPCVLHNLPLYTENKYGFIIVKLTTAADIIDIVHREICFST